MQPTDDELIAFLRETPQRSVRRICERFELPYCNTDAYGSNTSYTSEAKAIRNQLQRLRKARRIRSEGQRWSVC